MVWDCCICKVTQGVVDNISFHRIPKNESQRMKWIIAIGREVSKSSSVCSRHFNESDFYYKPYGNGIKRFLKTEVVPSVLIGGHDGKKSSNDQGCTSEQVNANKENQNIRLQSTISNIEDSENEENKQILESFTSASENLDSTDTVLVKEGSDKDVNDVIYEDKACLKRKKTEPLTGAKRFCNPRYVGDLRRDDFTSDLSFTIVQNYVKETQLKIKTIHRQVKRLNKKVHNFKELVDHLKENELLSEEALSVLKLRSSSALHDIFNTALTNKKPISYSPVLKEFSCTLLFYSSSAYKYVRSNFFNSLPHPQTVRRWFSKVDFSPGISKQVLSNIRDMIEDERNKGKELQFGLQVDEMSIKKQIELRNNEWHGIVDIGSSAVKSVKSNATLKSSNEASHALVFMIVSLNGHFKTPIAYYFINSLSGETRGNILKEILVTLHENGISDVRSVTFDGASTNLSMVGSLGANIQNTDECVFEHPVTSEPVICFPDACHMIKLCRNTFGEFLLMDEKDNEINWKFIEKLVDFQEKEKCHLGTKIRRRHINFHKEKMKVKLAVQTLSTRVANALTYMEMKFPTDFHGASATSTFCQNFNDIFDIMNSRRKYGISEWQSCVTIENLEKLERKISDMIKYIQSLKIKEGDKIMYILKCKRKTGFWGLIVNMKNVLKLAKYIFNNNLMSYLLTYKLSQDHLETFFSCMRRMSGFNNNPTCFQFRCSYKKLVCHVNSVISEGNCTPQDDTQILKIKQSKSIEQVDHIMSFDHDYVGSNGWSWNEYQNDVVTYIAGFIIKSIQNKIKCQMCRESLSTDKTTCDLIKIKNRCNNGVKTNDIKKNENKRGLHFPSSDVIAICKTAEKVIRSHQNLFVQKNILDVLMIHARKLLLDVKLFEHIDMLMEKATLSNHKMQLINSILQKYFKIRLHHESRSLQDNVKRIRTFHNRLVVFQNQ